MYVSIRTISVLVGILIPIIMLGLIIFFLSYYGKLEKQWLSSDININ